MILDTDSANLRRFPYLVASRNWQKAYLKVTYLPTVYNDGEYMSRKELLKAWRDFTEADLIRDTYKEKW